MLTTLNEARKEPEKSLDRALIGNKDLIEPEKSLDRALIEP
jgi:hypothetical protein